MKKNKAGFFLALTVCAAIFLLGAGFLFSAIYYKRIHSEISSWPKVNAKIFAHEIYTAKSTRFRPLHGRFAPVWLYTYEINGQKYEGRSDSTFLAYALKYQTSAEQAELLALTRPNGSNTTIIVSSKDPSLSILDLNPYNSNYFFLLLSIGVSVLLIASFGFLKLIQISKKINSN